MAKETMNKVLQAVCAVAKPGEYIILSRSELASGLPAGTERREIDSAMMELQADDYISVRYSDGDVYCLTVQTKGFVAYEKIKEQEEQRREEAELRMREKASLVQTTDNQLVAAAEDEALVSAASPKQDVQQLVAYKSGISIRRLFWACFGGALFGGVIAGVIVAFLSKIL